MCWASCWPVNTRWIETNCFTIPSPLQNLHTVPEAHQCCMPILWQWEQCMGWEHMAVQKPICTWNVMSWMKLELQRTEIPFQEVVGSCFWLVYKFQEHIYQQDGTESHQNIPSREWVVMLPWKSWAMGDSQKLLGGIQKTDLQGLFCLLLAEEFICKMDWDLA